MTKVDLITGFLGSGKTSFLKLYVNHLLLKGLKVGIIENDYGAVNVDMMLLSQLADKGVEIETIAGACDYDCHKRRFKTKLIAMGMQNFDRVIIEPSGIFDVDEFFDIIHEEPLERWYEIGSVIAIVDASAENNLSEYSSYILASQTANAGTVVFSKTQLTDSSHIDSTINELNGALKSVKCNRVIGKKDIISKNWSELTEKDFELISNCGYNINDFQKHSSDSGYSSVYIMNSGVTPQTIKDITRRLFKKEYGKVFRVKGFIKEGENWLELNATENQFELKPIKNGQDIIIVIGEKINEEKIKGKF